jgi:hypothetical protein
MSNCRHKNCGNLSAKKRLIRQKMPINSCQKRRVKKYIKKPLKKNIYVKKMLSKGLPTGE